MARMRRFEIDELLVRPGTYFNPQTEVLIVVDDSPEIDQATFDEDAAPEGADWVLVSDEAPIDEAARDELLERFQVQQRSAVAPALDDEDAEDDLDDEDELEPDEDPEEL
jgi:ABC-type Fe3+ transport system substrate-binding protein